MFLLQVINNNDRPETARDIDATVYSLVEL